MPPKGAPSPTEPSYNVALAAIRANVSRWEAAQEAARPQAMRRLNRSEYANTIRDLFDIPYQPGADFPADDTLYGFDNIAEGLNLSPTLVEKYLSSAQEVLDRAIRLGERPPVQKRKYVFEDNRHLYPDANRGDYLGVYNGNAHLTLPGTGGTRHAVYIGGPALFGKVGVSKAEQLAGTKEGLYTLRARLVPRHFEPNEVASFTLLAGDGTLVAERDVRITPQTQEVVLEAVAYHDRSATEIGFELQWTNGNHLPWRRKKLLPGTSDYESSYWFLINYRQKEGKWVEWKPQKAEDIPFSYFDGVELEVAGPNYPTWPPPYTQKFLGSYLSDGDAEKLLSRFLPRAFRRPVTTAELAYYVRLVHQQRLAGRDPVEALKVALTAVLCSPQFLFLVEGESAPQNVQKHGKYALNSYELASRLSYFLWSSMPDDVLFQLAARDRLRDPAVLESQTTRMLADPKARALSQNFARQWLGLDKLASVMPEPKLFPSYSEALRDASRAETLACFEEILTRNLPVTEFLDARWTYLNAALAEHYQLPPLEGRLLRRIELPDERRGGLLTQASLLTLTSEATRTSPVLRGKYILERIFNRPPPPPPANVGSLIPDASKAKSVKEHLRIHRQSVACAGCHSRIDPYGLVLENYDATGRWRTTEVAHEDPSKPRAHEGGERLPLTFPIETRTRLRDGSTMEGISGLKSHLLQRRGEFVRGLIEQLTVYALGRGLRSSDTADLDAATRATLADNGRFQTLIRAIVRTTIFQTRQQSGKGA